MLLRPKHPPPSGRLAWIAAALVVLALQTSCGGLGIDRRDEHGMTSLMRAARHGDRAEVERLLRGGANVNAVVPTRDLREFIAFISWMQQLPESDIGYTPLLYAVQGGHPEIVRLLIEEGADVQHQTRDGETALSLALARSDLEVTRLLTAAGARLDAELLASAVARSTPEAVRFLLTHGADPNALPPPDPRRPRAPLPPLVIVAALRGDLAILELLVEAGADVNARDHNGWSALRWLRDSSAHHRQGADPAAMIALLEAAGARDEEGELASALFQAVRRKDAAGVRDALRAGADPNARDNRGVPPLVYAGNHAQPEIVDALVQAGAAVNASPEHDTTPLNAAIVGGSLEAVKILLAAGAAVNQPDHLRQTPMQAASAWKRAEVAALLLAAGARPDPGALSGAALNGDTAQVRALLAHGAEPNAGQGHALSEAARGCLSRDNTDVIRMLLDAGADPRIHDDYGYTALHRAAGLCGPPAVRLLLQRGADPNIRDGNGYTPLISAAGSGSVESVALLIAAGADVNARDVDGKSVLDYAADHPEVQQALRRAGAR